MPEVSPAILAHLRYGSARREVQVVHRDQDAALRRLEPVADVWQGARDDDAHRVVEVGVAHLLFDGDLLDDADFHAHPLASCAGRADDRTKRGRGRKHDAGERPGKCTRAGQPIIVA